MSKVRHFEFLSFLSWRYDGNEPPQVSKTRFELTSIFAGGRGADGAERKSVSKEKIHDNSALSCKY